MVRLSLFVTIITDLPDSGLGSVVFGEPNYIEIWATLFLNDTCFKFVVTIAISKKENRKWRMNRICQKCMRVFSNYKWFFECFLNQFNWNARRNRITCYRIWLIFGIFLSSNLIYDTDDNVNTNTNICIYWQKKKLFMQPLKACIVVNEQANLFQTFDNAILAFL